MKLSYIRIIGGQWRSRRLQFPQVAGLRPTLDRVRETVFNWLVPHILQARCLDLFAGTGALGFEALSRGAASADLVEESPWLIKNLVHNARLLQTEQAHCINQNALRFIKKAPDEPYDIIFLDPPYESLLLRQSVELLNESGLIKPGTLIYFETLKRTTLNFLPSNWNLLKHNTTSSIQFGLWEVVTLQQ